MRRIRRWIETSLLGTLLYSYPILMLQLSVLLLSHSWMSFTLAAISLVFALALWSGVFADATRRRFRQVEEFINKFPESNFVEIDPTVLHSMLTPEMRSRLYTRGGDPKIAKHISASFSPERLHVVVIKPCGSDSLSAQIAAYPTLFGTAFIFLRDDPQDLSAFNRFNLLHEIGHTSKRGMADLFLEVARRTWFWNFFWICLFADWTGRKIALLLLIFLAQIVFRFEWSLWAESWSDFALRLELEADRFALHGLTREDLVELRQDLLNAPLIDSRLTSKPPNRGNEYRNFVLLRHIDAMLSGAPAPHLDDGYLHDEQPAWYNFLTIASLALIGQSVHPWKTWTAIAFTALLVWSWRTNARIAFWRRERCRSLVEWKSSNATPSRA